MADIRMGPAETQFAEIIWASEPIVSGALSKKAEEVLNWKKTTSFAVLKRLCERGIFQNQNGIVTSLISRESWVADDINGYIQDEAGNIIEIVPHFHDVFPEDWEIQPGRGTY